MGSNEADLCAAIFSANVKIVVYNIRNFLNRPRNFHVVSEYFVVALSCAVDHKLNRVSVIKVSRFLGAITKQYGL